MTGEKGPMASGRWVVAYSQLIETRSSWLTHLTPDV